MEDSLRKKRAVVIGGANIDLCGCPKGELRLRDSNPGTVYMRPGGVARNIAHDLCLMGMDVSLIAAIGGDIFGSVILSGCTSLGMDMSMAVILPDRRSSTYLYLTDRDGDMFAAVNEMEISAEITPERLSEHIDAINSADAVVIDANLSPEAIAYLADKCTAPLYADAVSAAKAGRLRPILSKLMALKPNALEAEALTGLKEPEAAAQELLRLGVRRVFISLGAEGMSACNEAESIRVPGIPVKTVNTNGAGDSVIAAIVCAGALGYDIEKTAELAVKAGAVTASSPETNAPGLSRLFAG